MKCPISKRLLCCAQMVPQGACVADIGTDHGYLGIHLLQEGVCSEIIAADLRAKPLQSARRNAAAHGVDSRMRFVLSNGLQNIKPESFDALVCAGMGGDCISMILAAAPWLRAERYTLILQPQTSANDLRRWLGENGFDIREERLVRDGRFLYVVIKAQFGKGGVPSPGAQYVSPVLLASQDPLLPEYLERLERKLAITVAGVSASAAPKHVDRLNYFSAALEEVRQMRETL